jgi:DNA sulfur modification protein DndD
MKLLTLQMKNFRQFYGETPKIQLAEGERNITVFHGANGSGKTTILNAATWLFYSRFTDAFAAPDRLVNKRALRLARTGEKVECWVELMFEHHGKKYVLKRSKTVVKTGSGDGFNDGPSRVSLDMAREDGRWSRIEDADVPDVIGRILPEKLMPYFFFDGERLESLQRANKQPDVISATTMLVGEEVISRGIEHLDSARKKIEAELKQIGDSETKDLLEVKNDVEAKLQQLQERQQQWSKNLDGYRKQKNAIDEALRQLASVRELQNTRDILTRQSEDLERTLGSARKDLAKLISEKGYQAYLKGAMGTFRDIIAGLRKQGELPASIKATFVEDMLRREMCICGRPLHPGEAPYHEVDKWRQRGGMSDVEETALRMEAEINTLDRAVPQLYDQLDGLQESRLRAKEQLSKVEVELGRIGQELKGSSEENARDLENRRTALDDGIMRTQRHQIDDEKEIKQLEAHLASLEKELDRRRGVTEQQQLVNRRLLASKEAIATLTAVRDRLRTNFRMDLTERINGLFSKMSFKPYRAILDQGYCLTLVDGPSDTPVGPSTGESTLLSLSFIGAVIDQARELTAARDRLPGPDSSVFPVVMDSPFGNLDPIYRRQVAKHIPVLAYQVVMMVSKTQFQGEVENTMHNRIGKEYVLRYHSPKADAHEDKILRGGVAYELIMRSPDEDEWTEIVEVNSRG